MFRIVILGILESKVINLLQLTRSFHTKSVCLKIGAAKDGLQAISSCIALSGPFFCCRSKFPATDMKLASVLLRAGSDSGYDLLGRCSL